MNEKLEQAVKALKEARELIREAAKLGNSVESIILFDAIEACEKLRQRVSLLQVSRQSDIADRLRQPEAEPFGIRGAVV